MISVCCVYNDENILKDYLFKGLDGQTAKFEFIKEDNTGAKFKSASEALNYMGRKAEGKYLMFAHQDVDLSSKTWLADAENMLDSIPDLGIAGVSGITDESPPYEERGRNVIKHGCPPQDTAGIPIDKPEKVQTLDECLLIIPKTVFKQLEFDEKVCDDWHFYAADYCLSVKNLGLAPYAIPMFIYHRSAGYSLSPAYYKALSRVLKKHRDKVKFIYKPGKAWSVYFPVGLQKLYYKIKYPLIEFMIKIGLRALWRKSGLKGLYRKCTGFSKSR